MIKKYFALALLVGAMVGSVQAGKKKSFKGTPVSSKDLGFFHKRTTFAPVKDNGEWECDSRNGDLDDKQQRLEDSLEKKQARTAARKARS